MVRYQAGKFNTGSGGGPWRRYIIDMSGYTYVLLPSGTVPSRLAACRRPGNAIYPFIWMRGGMCLIGRHEPLSLHACMFIRAQFLPSFSKGGIG